MRELRSFRNRSRGWLRHGSFLVIAVALAATGVSCCRSDRTVVHPTQGSVRFQGQPATGALVVFHPLDTSPEMQKLRPGGNVEADGKYYLSTYGPKDGAPAGKYRVTVIWASPGSGERPGPDRLGGRYANPSTTPLTATVAEGDNQIEPFELTLK
jgi:hypothetical protein